MRSLVGQPVPRELLIALPEHEIDLYRVHQLVWSHVAKAVDQKSVRPSFIFRIDAGMVRVRSNDLPSRRCTVSVPIASRPLRIDLAAVWGGNHDETVPHDMLESWCLKKLATAGYGATQIDIEMEHRDGVKFIDGRSHKINIPVARCTVHDWSTLDSGLSGEAWIKGIGRGKRFGLGMLAH